MFDDELRRLASEIVEEATHFIVAYSQEQAVKHALRAGEITNEMQARVNGLLKELF